MDDPSHQPSAPVTRLELDQREIAAGLQFPEGPTAMADGSVLVTEIARGTLSRVDPTNGDVEVRWPRRGLGLAG